MGGNITEGNEEISPTLFDARNFYYIGNFMGSINSVLPEQSMGNPELLPYLYYSYLAIDSGRLIMTEIKENNTTALIAFRYLYDYLEKPEKRSEILEFFTNKLQQDCGETNVWQMTAAIIFCREGQFDNVLKCLNGSNDLESMALTIQCLLSYNRIDLAKQILAKMQEKCDDATLTQLAQAWIGIGSGGEGLEEAYHIYQEFCEKYQPTPLLLNGQAVCRIGQERYDEADALLKESLAKNHKDYNTLINMITLAHLTGKEIDVSSRYLDQLKQFYPESDFIKDYEKKSDEFDKLCSNYRPEVVL